jgi:hypothetical protein
MFSVTVQVLVALLLSDAGPQLTPVGWGAVADSVKVCEPPFRLAVSSAL